jgi:hypothetical protein
MPPVPPDQRSPFPTSRKPRPAAASASAQDDGDDDRDDRDDRDDGRDDGDDDDPPASRKRISHRGQDRGSGNDDDVRPLQRWIRYADLKRARIVGNWTQLLRLIELQNFPPGTMLSSKVRAWTVSEIEGWLASRPPAGKRHEQDADAAGRARKAAATR